MKKITIGEKEYTIEYSIAASLYNECIESIMDMLIGIESAKESTDFARKAVSEMANLPQVAITLLYAGLLEKHGEEWGDGSVKNRTDAVKLAAEYIKANKLNWYSFVDELMTEVSNDNFFELTGLNQMLEADLVRTPKKKRGGATA